MLLAALEKSNHFARHKISLYSYSEELVAKRLEPIDADKNQLQNKCNITWDTFSWMTVEITIKQKSPAIET